MWGEPNTAHASTSSIDAANAGNEVGHDLGQASGTTAHLGGETFEVVQLGSHVCIDADTRTIGVAETCLQNAEQALPTRNG